MDPLSVLGVVAATVQFVDFSTKLISRSFKIYTSKSGELCDEERRVAIAKDLRDLNGKIKGTTKAAIRITAADRDEISLLELCKGCDDVAQELLGALSKLQRNKKGRKWKEWESFRIALESIWSGDELDRLERRLAAYQQQVSLHILWGMRKQLEGGFEKLKDDQRHTRAEISRTRAEISRLISERNHWRERVESPFIQLVLHHLHFQRILDREERIPDAHQATFRWIFEPPRVDQESWADFRGWLESDSSIYWITGKAGAGKSTLMKFIGHNPKTTQILKKLARDRQLIIARFYFWNSGVELQMTQEGLLRTLIHDIIQQCHDLFINTFPQRWEIFRLFELFDPDPVDYFGLKRLLDQIIKANPSTQFAFFIDGLDEFIGDPSDLAAYAKQLSENTNTKVCVSSRPWNEFEDAFACTPSLRVEDLTYPDMICFIQSNFNTSPGYVDFQIENEKEAEALLHAIASKASGVFLWVSLVVKLLLSGLTNGERLSRLRRHLDSMPPDLEQLFQKMLDQIRDEDKEDASRIFQIVRTAIHPPTVITLAWADEDDPNLPFDRAVEPLSSKEKDAKSQRMNRRLRSHCRGFLEAQRSSLSEETVNFLHRTVKDLLYRDEVWSKLQSYTPTSFHPEEALSRSYLLRLKTEPVDERLGLAHGPIGFALKMSVSSTTSDMLVQFVRYTHKMYEKTGDAQLPLFGELAKKAKDIFCLKGRCRSTAGVCWCEGPVDHDDEPFLSLAVALQIIPYVDARLTSLPTHKAENPKGQSIFQTAVQSDDIFELSPWKDALCYTADRFELLRLLLARGADPNLSTDPKRPSAWQDLLHRQRRARMEHDIGSRRITGWYCTERHMSALRREMLRAQFRIYYASFVRRFKLES